MDAVAAYVPCMSDNALQILEWLSQMGDEVALADEPIDRFAESAAIAREKSSNAEQRSKAVASTIAERASRLENKKRPPSNVSGAASASAQATLPDENTVKSACEMALGAESLEALRSVMEQFDGCNLKRSSTSMVFADGNSDAKVMLIGEAPGRDEDIQGLPFVGRSGQLLDRMLSAIELDREKVYITNVIPWRPPGNRAPTPAETEICRPFIERHIELMKPELIVLIGGSSTKMLLQTKDGILKLRGKWQALEISGRKIDTIATLHPAYLLRQPAQKKLAWQDLLKIKAKIDEWDSLLKSPAAD